MADTPATQRIDVWLWHARFYKTRSLATKMVRGGKVRLNGNICKKSSTTVSPSDILTFSRADQILIAKIISIASRRGPAPEAQMLYEDLTPPQEIQKKSQKNVTAPRYKGAGRPTKNERRAIDKLMNRD
ncbi:MAG: RNA-binding S4 domain-containing protein [Kordiimonadaceae bacterium]|jgi:ribosome-associated heat shock protein Hsp15|nr:RNA-binding S4 domain-containing protein [Kordiimonadaceae bacterium]MBT6035852.1 RNA-binding S4 domain-containing protein [Kordiimonadaceae bacterium]MBT6328177.1 RNA-binding S4 domain-containing protein [Kordiimonadaceae bacterium]MBT7582966.1 RNA-binding S4 domain-containing protein [Kordiimonadaceae bacterium]